MLVCLVVSTSTFILVVATIIGVGCYVIMDKYRFKMNLICLPLRI